MRSAGVAVAAVVIGWAAAGGAAAQSPGAPASPVQSVLFLCPHGAAKSVLASAYFERLARARGLTIRVQSAGTDPDPAVAPVVAEHLRKQGYEVPAAPPRKTTAQDLATADIVVSIGCDLSGLPQPRGSLRRWDDVPAPSADFAGADAAIRRHAEALVEELARAAEQARRRRSP
jgi:arsenate reductase (thioredoxin)